MAAWIFISYRRAGGDMAAKLICEALKNRGYKTFYDYDALKGGPFDEQIRKEIINCTDMVLVLPPNALERCDNEEDWVRQEIKTALEYQKNIIPVMLEGFEFPKDLPDDINRIRRYNGVRFHMEFFDAVIDKIIEHLCTPMSSGRTTEDSKQKAFGKLTIRRPTQFFGVLRGIKISIDGVASGSVAVGSETSFDLPLGVHSLHFNIDWLKADLSIELSPSSPESVVEVKFKTSALFNSLEARIIK